MSDTSLGACSGFSVPGGIVPLLEVPQKKLIICLFGQKQTSFQIRHFGPDTGQILWVRVMLDDYTHMVCDGCENDGWIDEIQEIKCTCHR